MPLRGEGLGVVLDRAAEGGECFQGLSDFGGRSGLSDLHSAGNQVHGVVGMRGPHCAGDVMWAFDAFVFYSFWSKTNAINRNVSLGC